MDPIRHPSRVAFALVAMLGVFAPATSGAAAKAAPGHAAAHAVVPFIDDDLPRALAAAKQSDRPIFVESWAPW